VTEYEFNARVQGLLDERAADNLHALDLGRRFKELCAEYLESNDHLPESFSVFEDSTPYVERGKD
jgi:hypothetical protein